MPLTSRLALIALACACIASFLPWVRVLFISVNGTDGDGMLTVVTAAAGFGFVYAGERTSWRPLLLHTGAIVGAALTALVYVYNLADVSHAAGESADAFFDLQISPQFGLIVGAAAAPIALFVTALRLRDLVGKKMPWLRSDVLTGCLAVSALPFAISPSLWVVSALVVIALSFVLWLGARRTPRLTAPSALAVIALVVAAGGTVYGVLDDDSRTPMSSEMAESLQGFDVDDLEECAGVFAEGAPTNDLDEAILCLDGGADTYVFPITWDCEDGRTLVSNDYGWGYSDSEWTTRGEAPFDRCRSAAEKPCKEIFVDGQPTREEWSDGFIECFDTDDEIDYVITSRWDCFDSDDVQLSNRYGWGHIGEEWIGDEEAPFC